MSNILHKKSISRKEMSLISFITTHNIGVFTPETITTALGWSKQSTYSTISKLRRKGYVETVLQGKYVLDMPIYDVSIERIASELYWPSYISFWTALSYHGLTDQLPHTVYVVNTKRTGTLQIRNTKIRFVRFKPQHMFGYEKTDGFMATPEKAVTDSLHLPKYAGGIKEIEKAFKRDLNIERVERYAEEFSIDAVQKRVAYLLHKNNIQTSLTVNGTYVKLDPSNGKGTYLKEHCIEDNVYA